MTDSKHPKNVLRGEEKDEFSHWRLPEMSSDRAEAPANLLGRRPGEVYVAPDEEEFRPPTLAEIEAIRQEAELEGFEAGKQDGLARGLEEGRLQGLQEGHQEGLQQGHEQGLQQGLSEAKQMLARFEAFLGQFSAPLALLDNEIEQELLNLSMALARQILLNELKTHPEHILAALREGIDCLPIKEQQVKVRLNPDDLALLQQIYDHSELERNRWQLESDPLLSRGGLIIDSHRSRVDMRLEERMANVLLTPLERLDTLARDARTMHLNLEEQQPVVEENELNQTGTVAGEEQDDSPQTSPAE
ncbi:flagellar assembly protein FliH [Shewanella sp.]|uniref:flagellar assembly protein FliH n=1 Tax=Shewanella sp. TaxID=50422 RepID=UPI003569B2F0